MLLIACAAQPPGLRELPELPAEFAQNLAIAHTAPVLMTKPPPGAALRRPRLRRHLRPPPGPAQRFTTDTSSIPLPFVIRQASCPVRSSSAAPRRRRQRRAHRQFLRHGSLN